MAITQRLFAILNMQVILKARKMHAE